MCWRPAASTLSASQTQMCMTTLRVSSKSSKARLDLIERKVPSPGCCAADLSPTGRGEESEAARKSLLPPQNIRHLRDVLVAAAGEIDHHQMILWPLRREFHHLGDGVCRLKRGNDAFQP